MVVNLVKCLPTKGGTGNDIPLAGKAEIIAFVFVHIFPGAHLLGRAGLRSPEKSSETIISACSNGFFIHILLFLIFPSQIDVFLSTKGGK